MGGESNRESGRSGELEILLPFPSFLSRIHLSLAIAHPRSQSSSWSEQTTDPAGLEHQVTPLTTLPFNRILVTQTLCPCPHDSRVLTFLFSSPTPSYVGDIQIDVEVKKYFCKAGVKGMQVGQMSEAHSREPLP